MPETDEEILLSCLGSDVTPNFHEAPMDVLAQISQTVTAQPSRSAAVEHGGSGIGPARN